MDLTIVEPKNNGALYLDIKKHEIKTKIIERINKMNFPEITKYKSDLEFLNLVMTLTENLVDSKKINKKDLVFDVLTYFFKNLTEDEKKMISNNIEYLLDSKQVKKVSMYKLFCVSFKEFIGIKKRFREISK